MAARRHQRRRRPRPIRIAGAVASFALVVLIVPALIEALGGEPPAEPSAGAESPAVARAPAGLPAEAEAAKLPDERAEPLPEERLGGLERIAERFADRGEVGIAVAPLAAERVALAGSLRTGRAWSAIKVPLVTSTLRRGSPDPRLDRLVDKALKRSDNEAAKRIYAELGSDQAGTFDDAAARVRLQRTLDSSGARIPLSEQRSEEGRTETGTTEWHLREATTFFRELGRGCLLDPASNEYLRAKLERPISRQRWGVFAAGRDAEPVIAKGGWGPDAADITVESSWLVEQLAVVGEGGRGYALGLMVRTPATGAGIAIEPKREFESFPPLRDGAALLTDVSRAVLDQLGPADDWRGQAPPACAA